MSEILVRFTPGATDNSVQVDGFEIKDIVKRVTAVIEAGKNPSVEVDLHTCEIDAVGEIRVNAEPIPEPVAAALYEALRRRYGETPEPQP